MVPYCNDPSCVYHHPRPNVNAGGPSLRFVDSFEMIGGVGMEAPVPLAPPSDVEGVAPVWIEPLPPPRDSTANESPFEPR